MCKRCFRSSVASLCGLLVFALNVSAQTGESVVYHRTGDIQVRGYLAKPTTAGKHPAMILVHEWWGLNKDIEQKAKDFAAQGYVSLAVDLYNGQNTTERAKARELATNVRQNMPEAFDNLKSAISFLSADGLVDGTRLASVGWCFGGGWSYQIAKNNLGVKASVIYYGRFNPEDDLKKMRASIIGHFAENDRGILVDKVHEFQAKLKTLHGLHEIFIYPNTQHSFASRPGENDRFDEAAAALAWQRTLAFLKKTL